MQSATYKPNCSWASHLQAIYQYLVENISPVNETFSILSVFIEMFSSPRTNALDIGLKLEATCLSSFLNPELQHLASLKFEILKAMKNLLVERNTCNLLRSIESYQTVFVFYTLQDVFLLSSFDEFSICDIHCKGI